MRLFFVLSLANSTKMCYTYDDLNRVESRTIKNSDTDEVISTETFSYDLAGNITGGSANTTFVYKEYKYETEKALLVFAIIFNIIAILFFVAFALIYFDNDTSGFTDNLTYSEGIVKEVNPNTNDNNKIIAYSIVLENNVIMTIDTDTIESEGVFSYVNKGDTVTFAFNGSAEKVANTNERIFVTPAFLSCDDKIIVSIESYEQSLLNNKNVESFIGLIAASIFLIVSAMLYFLWFYKIKK